MAEAGVALRELEARPVTDLAGVGEGIARSLHGVGVTSVLDLISYYPRRYLDRTREATLGSLKVGEEGMVLVRVEKASTRRTRRGRTLVEVRVPDGGKSFVDPWPGNQLPPRDRWHLGAAGAPDLLHHASGFSQLVEIDRFEGKRVQYLPPLPANRNARSLRRS